MLLHRRLRPGRPARAFVYSNIGNTHELADIGTLAFGAYNGVHLIFAHNKEFKDIVTIQASEFMNRHVIGPPMFKLEIRNLKLGNVSTSLCFPNFQFYCKIQDL